MKQFICVLLCALGAASCIIDRSELVEGADAQLRAVPDVLAADGSAVSSVTLKFSSGVSLPPGVNVVFSSTEPSAIITQPAGPSADATYIALVSCKVAGTQVITAAVVQDNRVVPLRAAALITFNAKGGAQAGVPNANFSTLEAVPTVVGADGSTQAHLTLTVRDGLGNAVPGAAVTFAASGSQNAFSIESGLTDLQGVLTAELASTVAETKTVTAHIGAAAVVTSVQFSDDAMSVLTSTLVATPNTQTADGISAASLQFAARSVAGTPMAGVQLLWGSTGTSNAFGTTSSTTDASGQATTALTSTRSEAKTVTASVDGNPVATQVLFVPGPASSRSYMVAGAGNGNAVADDVQAVTITTVVVDAQGNLVAGQTVTVTGPNGAQTSGVTDPSGVYVTSVMSTSSGIQSVTALIAGTVTITTQATFVAGAVSTTNSTLTVNPASLVADGVATTQLQVALADAKGNPVPGITVTLSSDGSANTLSDTSGITDAAGNFTTTMRSTRAEIKNILASVGAATLSAQVTFVAGPPSQLTSTITPASSSVAADGVTTGTLVVTVNDAAGNPVENQPVGITSDGTNIVLTQLAPTTAADGTTSVTLASNTLQTVTVTAAIGVVTETATVTFSAGAPSSSTTTFTASPSNVVADGTSTTTLTVTVHDSTNNPVAGQGVTFSSSGTDSIITPTTAVTDAFGNAAATLTSSVAETKTVKATVGSFNKTQAVVFTAGAPSASKSTLVVSPAAVTADNTTHTTLTFTVEDAQGNPVSGQAVTFAVSGSNNALSASTGTTSPSGVFTATLASSKAETKTVTASAGALSQNQSVTFFAGAPSGATSTLVATPSSLTADGAATTTLSVTVLDAQNNIISGQAVTFSASGTNNTLSPVSGTTSASGIFSSTLKSTKAQSETVTATFAAASSTAAVTFVAGAPSTATTTFTSSPASVIADGTATSNLSVTVQDAQGNPVVGQAVTLSSTGSTNTFTPVSGSTLAGGIFTATLKSTTAEVKTVTAAVGSLNKTVSVTFTAGSASSTTTTFTASPTTLTANGTSTSTLTVTVKDAQGNLVSNQSVSLASTGTANTFAPASGNTNASGVFVATLASTKAESKSVTATAGAASKTASVLFQAGVPANATTTLSVNPASVTADGTSSSTVTVTALDAQGNPVSAQSVTLASTGSGNAFSATSGSTNASGVFTASLTSTHAETKTITATVASVTKTAAVAFTVGAPSSTTTTVAASPSTVTADGSTSSTLSVTVKDAQGNVVSGQAVTLSSSGSNNTFGQATGTTNASGVYATTLTSTHAETKTITATAGAATATASVQFNAGASSSTTTTLTASPASVAADGVSTTTLRTTVLDAQGNPISGQTVTVTSVTGSNNTLTPSSGTTDASGTFAATLASTNAEGKVVTVSVGGSFNKTTSVTFTVPLVSTTNSTLVASPTSLVADGNTLTVLTVTVKDGTNTAVANQAVTFTSTGSANVFSPSSGTTNSSGMVVVNMASTHAELKTVTATVDGTAINANVTFTPGAATSSTSSVVANPNMLAADGSSTSTLTVVIRDINSNPVPSQSVTLSSSGGSNTFSATTGNTDATGTFTATLSSTLAQSKTVTATMATFSKTAAVIFAAGAPSTTTTTFAASPTTLVADGTTITALTVTVKDAQGNVVPGQAVSLSSTGTNNTFTPISGSTNSSGVFTATLASTKAEAKTLTASAGAVTKTTGVSFVAGAPANSTSTLVAAPASLTADGTTTTALTLTVQDAQGNPVVGQAIALASSGSSNSFGSISGSTNSSGVFTTTLASTVAQAKTLTATIGSIAETTTVNFVAGAASSATTTLVASPTTLVADGATTTTLTLNVKDAQGNVVAGQAVSIASSGSSNTLTPLSGTTNASGLFTATLASTKAEAKTVTATIGSFTKNATVTFNAGAPAGAQTTFMATPTTLTADGVATSTLTLTVLDAQGNVVSGLAVSFNSTGTGNTFSPAASGTTNSSGVFTATMTSTVAQTKTITATIGSITKTATVIFQPGAASSTTSSIGASPALQTADGTSIITITVTVEDAKGNVISGQAVTLAVGGTGNTVGSTSGTTNASGVWTTAVKSTKAEAKTITATVAGFNLTTTPSFVAGAASNTTTTFTASPASVVDDGVTTTTLTVTVKDVNGNLVNAQAVTFSASGASNTFSATTGSTNSSGIFTATLKSTLGQSETLTATFAGFTKTTPMTFFVGAPNSAKSSVVASPTSVVANGTTTTTITVTVKDSTGNVIGGQAVNLASSGSNNTFSAASGNTNASGIFTATLESITAQSKTITATIGAINETTTVTFTAGVPATSASTLTVNPNQVVANGTSTSVLTFTVEDINGNLIAGQAATFTSSNGAQDTFAPSATGTTNASGVFTATVTSKKAEASTITAKAGAASLAGVVTFVAGSPNSTTSTLLVSPTTLVANNTSTAALTVTLKDQYGNLASGQTVTFGPVAAYNTFTPASGTTNASGVLTATLASTKSEVKIVTATESTATESAAVTFVAGPPVKATSTLKVSPTSGIPANDSNTTLVTATLKDQYSNLVTNYPVSFNTANTASPAFSLSGNTTTTGVFTFSLASSFAGAKVVIDSFNAQSMSAAVTFAQTTAFCTTTPFYGATPVVASTGLTSAYDVVAADMNADGKMDIVISDPGTNSVGVAIGKGNGRFAAPLMYATGQSGTTNITVCDFSGDGYPDVATVNRTSRNVSFFRGSSTGALGAAATLTLSGSGDTGRQGIACADMTHDSKLDLIVAFAFGNGIEIFPNNGSGVFSTATGITSTLSVVPYGVAVGDATGDGNQDVLIPTNDGFVRFYPGRGNGGVGGLVSYTVGAGNLDATFGDLNNDGRLDIISADNTGGTASVLLNQGGGVYPSTPTTYTLPTPPSNVSTGDLNGDGKLDVIISNAANVVEVSLGSSTGALQTFIKYHVGPVPGFIDVADFNGDGKMDVVAPLQGFGISGAAIVLGKGDGTLVIPRAYPTQPLPQGLAVGDVNGDGSPDMVVSNANTPFYVNIFTNSGAGIFTSTALLPVSAQPRYVSLVDLNGDQKLDIVTQINAGSGGISVRLNLGGGSFGAESVHAAGGVSFGMAVGDFNADGIVDLATANALSGSGDTVSVLIGTASGGYAAPVSYVVNNPNSNPHDVVATDVNGDGIQDLLVAYASTVDVLKGVGNGTFTAATQVASSGGGSIENIALGDFNLDAHTDFVCEVTNNNTQGVYTGSGTGTFTAGAAWGFGASADVVTTSDFNGDGLADALTAIGSGAMVALSHGTASATFTTDYYVAGNGPSVPVAADFDGDGHMDFAVLNNDQTLMVYLYTSCP